MTVKEYNRDFLPRIQRAREFVSLFESAINHMDDARVDKEEVRKQFRIRSWSDEVCNCLIWRQQDATRNSIESVGHANFSQKELHGKSCNSIQDMLWKERGINWNDFPVDCKRGSACYKTKVKETAPLLNDKGDTEMVEVVRNRWVIDREPPIFSQERGYVEKWI